MDWRLILAVLCLAEIIRPSSMATDQSPTDTTATVNTDSTSPASDATLNTDSTSPASDATLNTDSTSPASDATLNTDSTSPASDATLNTALFSTTDLSTTTATVTTTSAAPAAVFILIFAINEVFVPELDDTSSTVFKKKSAAIISEVGPLYKNKFAKFIRMLIKQFRRGSIITESEMSFSSNAVSANQLKDTLLNGISGLTFTIDPNSINITQTVGNSMSPVIAGSVSMICMSLLSLLLSLALHF